MSKVQSYFNTYTHQHAYHKEPDFYHEIVSFVNNLKSRKVKILDVGCGDGSFIKAMLLAGIDTELFIGTDISLKMLNIARSTLKDHRIQLLAADGFNLPLQRETKFDIIHLDSVLHHLIGNTRAKSLGLAHSMLSLLLARLAENGILIVEEMYYNSYIIPNFTSSSIFYGLKLVNLLHLNLSKIINEFQPGLEVNIMHDKELEKLLKIHDSEVLILKKLPWKKIPKLYQLFLLKDGGHITYRIRLNCANM